MKHNKRSSNRNAASDGTDKLAVDHGQDSDSSSPRIDFPSLGAREDSKSVPHWRVLFEHATNPTIRFGLDLYGEVILGRGGEPPNIYDLTPYAIKYSPSITKIDKILRDGDEITLTVSDVGPGVPEDDIPHVFDKCFRGRRVGGYIAGARLGLATVKAAVDGTVAKPV